MAIIPSTKGVQSDIVRYGRDALALAGAGMLTYSPLRELGGILSIWLMPKIAATQDGDKTFVRLMSVLFTVDTFLERFSNKGAF